MTTHAKTTTPGTLSRALSACYAKAPIRQEKPGNIRLTRLVLPLVVLLFFSLALSGCAKLLDPGPAPSRIQLFPAMPEPSTAAPIDKQLIIDPPISGLDIATDSIALLFNGREVEYLSGYRWTSTAPAIFQRSMVYALMASNSLRGVNIESSALSADARLVTDIKLFHLCYSGKNQLPTADIEVVMQLISQKDGSVIDSKTLRASTKAAGNDVPQLMDAFESSLSRVLLDSVPWIEQSMRKVR